MSVVFNQRDVHIINKNNIVMIVKEVKYANIIVENLVVMSVVFNIKDARIINKNLNVMSVVDHKYVLIIVENHNVMNVVVVKFANILKLDQNAKNAK